MVIVATRGSILLATPSSVQFGLFFSSTEQNYQNYFIRVSRSNKFEKRNCKVCAVNDC